METNTPTPPPLNRRRWWLALILALLCPGLGQIYNTEYRRGLAIFAAITLLSSATFLILIVVPPISAEAVVKTFAVALIVLAVHVAFAIEAAVHARRIGSAVLGRANRWYVYVAFLVAIFAVQEVQLHVKNELALWRSYNMSSGSMLPTLRIGDTFMSIQHYYTDNQPQYGDIAVFKLPRDGTSDYVKRVVGLPGDQVQMRGGLLHINGIAAKRERLADAPTEMPDGRIRQVPQYRETLPNGRSHLIIEIAGDTGIYDDTRVFDVPPGEYFVLGDNRDNSLDSRVAARDGGVGFVPRANMRDRPAVIYWAADRQRIGLQIQP